MGQHHIGTNAQPVDVLALTECLNPSTSGGVSQTPIDLVAALNAYYGAGYYAYANYADPTANAGPSSLIYNTHTVQVLGATTLAYTGSTGIQRAPIRYELQPVGYGSNADFYIYVSHYHSGSASSDETIRNTEAQEIRADADALGPNAHIIYAADYNFDNASTETPYTTLLSAGNGKAYDPVSYPNASTWTNSSTTYQDLYSELSSDSNGGPLVHRYDLELVSGPMIGSTAQPGLQLASDTSDPYDPQDFPSKQYPFAYEIFGNDGTIPEGDNYDVAGNTALSDIPNASALLAEMEPVSGSDHLPVVADYKLVGVSVPEPSSLCLLAAPAALALLLARRREGAGKKAAF
jgi:hypothetical protein